VQLVVAGGEVREVGGTEETAEPSPGYSVAFTAELGQAEVAAARLRLQVYSLGGWGTPDLEVGRVQVAFSDLWDPLPVGDRGTEEQKHHFLILRYVCKYVRTHLGACVGFGQ
jgi:hypothetical protein